MGGLIDSSVFVALFLDNDQQHAKAMRLFDRWNGMMYLPYCVVNETASVLMYKRSKAVAEQFFDFLDGNRDVAFVDDNLQEEIVHYRSLPHRISFTDAALIQLSSKLKVKLITFDRQLEKIATSAK